MKPIAFFVIGPAGSGKSTVSRAVAQRYKAAYLDKDTIATAFTELILQSKGFDKDERDSNDFYNTVVLPIEYDTLLRTCGDNLRVGTSVVLDAPFGRYLSQRDYLESARRQHRWPDAELIVVNVKVDGTNVLQRLIRRDYGRDAWKIEHWHQFWHAAQQVECEWESARHITLENNGPVLDLTAFDQQLKDIVTI